MDKNVLRCYGHFGHEADERLVKNDGVITGTGNRG